MFFFNTMFQKTNGIGEAVFPNAQGTYRDLIQRKERKVIPFL